ncbi:MAG TPA: PhzF family phenazine biosynthesis protein [Acidimicrobiia bacterium]
MGAPLFIVDAFTEAAFGGNPAAVCLLDAPADPEWMQAVAAELNLSETAFVIPAGAAFGLRWFTPAVEVDLCGHATLASAHVLWEGWLPLAVDARFETHSGELVCTRAGDLIEMNLPADPPEPIAVTGELSDALGVEVTDAAQSRVGRLLALTDAAAVRALDPDFGVIARLSGAGVIVTAESDSPDADFVSRFFAPAAGIDEDPVTGAAHCALAPYWAARLGRDELVGYQASERGGSVRCRVDDDRVVLGGHAVTVTRGELLV